METEGAVEECLGMRYQPRVSPGPRLHPRDAIISGICSLLTLIAISSYLLTPGTLDAAKYLSLIG